MDWVSVLTFVGLFLLAVGAFYLVSILNRPMNNSGKGSHSHENDMVEQTIDARIYSNPLIRHPEEVKQRRVEDQRKIEKDEGRRLKDERRRPY